MAQARHRTTSSTQSAENELVKALWSALRPCALKLRDIMQSPSLRPPPGLPSSSSTPEVKVPSLANRRAACTHLTMDRLYGNFKCNVCNRPSELGWVYSCTQDDRIHPIQDSPAPPSSSLNDQLAQLAQLEDHMKYGMNSPHGSNAGNGNNTVLPTAELSPSVEKAIREGHYTLDQIATLRAQKQHVFNVAQAAIERFEESQRSATPSPSKTTTSQSVDANPHLPFPLINEVRDVLTTDTATTGRLSGVSKTRMFPYCKFRACQICRPTYRDRTWQCFNEIFNTNPPDPILILGDENRPLASVSIVRTIGLRSASQRPKLRRFDRSGMYSFDGEGKLVFRNQSHRGSPASTISSDSYDSSDIADTDVESESSGFRQSMKRAFRSMLATRQNQGHSPGRKRKARESTTTDEDAEEFDMGLWKELNDELLDEASGIPLPIKESMDSLNGGMKKAGIGGIAVTEEAAETNTADIIMSV